MEPIHVNTIGKAPDSQSAMLMRTTSNFIGQCSFVLFVKLHFPLWSLHFFSLPNIKWNILEQNSWEFYITLRKQNILHWFSTLTLDIHSPVCWTATSGQIKLVHITNLPKGALKGIKNLSCDTKRKRFFFFHGEKKVYPPPFLRFYISGYCKKGICHS